MEGKNITKDEKGQHFIHFYIYIIRQLIKQIFLITDLADVISDSAVVGDVQSILDCVVVALGELKGLFVTQLKMWRTKCVRYSSQLYNYKVIFIVSFLYQSSLFKGKFLILHCFVLIVFCGKVQEKSCYHCTWQKKKLH